MAGHRRHAFFLVSLALLLVSATHAAGVHATQTTAAAAITQQKDTTDDGVVGIMIGSAPPSCEGKCGWWCSMGRSCEAVQVPIEPPKDKKQMSRRHGSGGDLGASLAAQQQQRPSAIDGDHSNYKPIIWGCQCV